MSSETLLDSPGRERVVPARELPVTQQLFIALQNPLHAITVAIAIVRGTLFRWWCAAARPRVQVSPGLRIYGRLVIRGPGRVTLGKNIEVRGRVTPWTHHPEAHITIGDDTSLDGTRFGCVKSIRIGNDCLLAGARILDSSFHSLDRHAARLDILTAPVVIGNGVWLSPDSAVLPGTQIGDYSVVSLGAICKGNFADHSLLFGNPARVAAKLPAE